MAVQVAGRQVIKYTIDPVLNRCKGEVIDSGYKPYSVSCSPNGKVYINDLPSLGYVTVRIYDMKTGQVELWETSIFRDVGLVTSAVNSELITITHDRKSYVYSSGNRTLLYSRSHTKVRNSFHNTYLTNDNVLWGCTYNDYQLEMMHLKMSNSKVLKEGNSYWCYLSGTGEGYVMVTDHDRQDVSIYNEDGDFVHYLKLDDVYRSMFTQSAAIKRKDKTSHIAFTTLKPFNKEGPIRLYSLDP